VTTRPLVFKHLTAPHPKMAVAVLAVAAALALAFAVLDRGFRERSVGMAIGVVFGIALQRGELSLVRAWRDLIALKDSGQLLGFLCALGVAAALTLGGLILLGEGRPENARIGPVDWLLPVAAFVFGVGSVIARGGVMVHLRRLGEGSLVAAPALLATFAGFMVALSHWPWTWAVVIADAPRPWLPQWFGLEGALAVQLIAIAALAALLWRYRPRQSLERRPLLARVTVEPWPAAAAGALLGLLVAASYAVGEPLGLIAECAMAARWLVTALGLAPLDLPGLDEGIAGLAAPLITGFAVTEHVTILLGFLMGATACAIASGRFSVEGFSRRDGVEMLVGGLMIGWGVMTSLGAVTGEAIAGVAIGAVSGWVFLIFASFGVVAALTLDPRPMAHPAPVP
jgi:hypothetical protein